MKLKLFFPILFIGLLTVSKAENLDSLWSVWEDTAVEDTSRLNAIQQFIWKGYLFSQPDSACYFAQMQYDFAKSKVLKKQMTSALNNQGISYYFRDEYEAAIKYYAESIEIRKQIDDKAGMAASFNNIGMVYYDQGYYDQSIQYLNESLKIEEELGNKEGIASTLNNVGLIYKDQGEYAKAIDYYSRSLLIHREFDNKQGISNCLNNLGVVYLNLSEYGKALDFYTECLRINEKIGGQEGIGLALHNIGLVYSEKNNYVKAIDFFTRSLKIQKELDDKQGISASLNEIGKIYHEQKNFQKALIYCNNALKIAQEIGAAVEIKNAAQYLHESYISVGDNNQALKMFKLFVQTRDSIESEENQREIFRQEYKYKYDKKAAADSIKNEVLHQLTEAELSAERAEKKYHQQKSYFLYGGLVLTMLFGGFIYNRFRLTRKQKRIIELQKKQVDSAYEELEEKNTEILDSIIYAKRIQSAILPQDKVLKEHLQDFFILYKPKDVVAGDFYWLEIKNGKTLVAVADCTGHGVPGALVSVVCNNALNRSVREHGLTDPGEILDKSREIVIQEFEKSDEIVRDGMDIALCSIENKKLQYAGANNPLWILRNNEIVETLADRQPIGQYDDPLPYKTHTIELLKNDIIYLFSDGYADQFGGERGKKFKAKAFKELLLKINDESMDIQKHLIEVAFENWKENTEQIDDVCVIGVRI